MKVRSVIWWGLSTLVFIYRVGPCGAALGSEEQQQVTIINNLNTLYKTQFALVGDNDENQMGISIVGQFVLLLLWRAGWWITIESVNGRGELVSPTPHY